ncbi:hypothetical protein K474DRAFT_1599470 [Panus rudis PR-1116 ss-1]|nr:hypothetical protein K474DRAFT_1599470 [Panus rudis PR-1116 ss-1]
MEEASRLYQSSRYEPALLKYKEAIGSLLGNDFQIPLPYAEGGGVISKAYLDLTMQKRPILMACCEKIGELLWKLKKEEEALLWLDETEIIYTNLRVSNEVPMFDWQHMMLDPAIADHARVRAFRIASDVFLAIGNTGAATHRRHYGCEIAKKHSNSTSPTASALKREIPQGSLPVLYQFKHPDPNLIKNIDKRNDELQVLGSWQKAEIPRDKSIPPRLGFGSFVWNSRYYVVAGEKAHIGPYFKDMYYLDLSNMGAGWHPLPPYPGESIRCSGWKVGVHENKAYFFSGRRRIHYFDLIAEKWYSVETRCEGRWPYGGQFMDYCMETVNGKLYVFGGTHDDVSIGSSLFFCLDLNTLTWRKLSGVAGPPLKPDMTCPGPRRHATIWADQRVPGKERVYLMFGEADRTGAKFRGEPLGSGTSWTHEDFWSFDVQGETWRRERMVGNVPCPRSEMAYTFNNQLGLAIVFGGYSPTLPSDDFDVHRQYSFTYFADTFIYIPPQISPDSTASSSSSSSTNTVPSKTPKWKQVITRGFPTYRAQADLFTDPATGKTYLFGGYTNSQFVPDSKHEISRSFSDVWQLKLDVPGGHFEGVNLEEESRTAKAGPWQRCFNCGNAGPWKKCGGTCNGRAFFCEPQCHREGWRLHKEMHKCRKK